MVEKVSALCEKYKQVAEEIIKPEVIADNKKYTQLIKEYNNLQPIYDAYVDYKKTESDLEQAKEMLKGETDSDMISLFEDEIKSCQEKLEDLEENFKVLLLPKDEDDDKNVIMEIRSGAGGEEASLFSAVLFRMYSMFCEKNGYTYRY